MPLRRSKLLGVKENENISKGTGNPMSTRDKPLRLCKRLGKSPASLLLLLESCLVPSIYLIVLEKVLLNFRLRFCDGGYYGIDR